MDRAISVLQVLARLKKAGVTEIATELSVHKSTVSRLLGTLEARGLVEQAASRGRYRLAYGVVQLAEGASKKHDLAVISRTVCDALAEDVGETVNVVVHEGRAVVTIDQVIGSASITTVNWVGQRDPLHATSAGKVFLANMPRAEFETYVSAELERFTDHTMVDPGVLEADLARVRDNGYASTFEEQEIGLAAVAAPIRSLDGEVIAALTVSGPTFRIDRASIPKIAERLLPAAAQISERNGYPKAG
ncbi:IclR family transcriptional regulator [Kribbella sp. NPDC050124]|uniref:IclR family transcriptional regulator n=1 Tax=Kribbella sp. NPDC050124 TaxID=3364114 RepID=UPI0037A565FA